ncbi:MAG: hypothetical protein GQ544_09510 [Candidatus Aminicenantes bacterium]|nr:hypothetical protein [Candidatus Aminicenantes bacterium]
MLKRETEYLKPIHHKIRIDAPSEKVWEIISSPGNLENCHPFCESNPVEKWPGKESVDYVNYCNGLKFVRNFTDWYDGVGYELTIGKEKGRKSRVIWRIDAIDDAASYLSITIYPHDINRYPSFAKTIVHYLYIKPTLHKYLTSVLNGFKWYITTKKPVQKNQFGTHKWFS